MENKDNSMINNWNTWQSSSSCIIVEVFKVMTKNISKLVFTS